MQLAAGDRPPYKQLRETGNATAGEHGGAGAFWFHKKFNCEHGSNSQNVRVRVPPIVCDYQDLLSKPASCRSVGLPEGPENAR
jgi:hypothetical protein